MQRWGPVVILHKIISILNIMSDNVLAVEPIDIPKYNYENSKYERMPSLPARMLCVAFSAAGKTVFVRNLILKIYR